MFMKKCGAVANSEPGAERGMQTKQTVFAVCVPSRREGERREQAQHDNKKCGGERSRGIAPERRAKPKAGRRPNWVCPETEKL